MSETASSASKNEIELTSGAKLRIDLAPFNVSKALYQAILGEVKGAHADPNQQVDANFIKDIFCLLQDSKRIENAVWDCMGRCLYNGEKITDQTFEDEKAREDYLEICVEVARRNVSPFTKNLFAKYKGMFDLIVNIQKSPSEKTTTT